jgi:hypothetical protein
MTAAAMEKMMPLGGVDRLWRSQIFQLSECLSGSGLGVVTWVARWAVSTAVVGGVAGPVAAAGALPGGGDADVDAEQPGEHGGGQFGGQPEQRCGPGLPGAQPELAESLGELFGADRLAGPSAGEEPAGAALLAECRVPVPGGDQAQHERGEGFGQLDRFASETQPHLLLVDVDVVEGEPGDRGGVLGVKQDEQSGDAVFGPDRVVVQQAAGLRPALFGVQGAVRAVPPGGGELETPRTAPPTATA